MKTHLIANVFFGDLVGSEVFSFISDEDLMEFSYLADSYFAQMESYAYSNNNFMTNYKSMSTELKNRGIIVRTY